MVTLKDVAERAGVSQATASLALNYKDGVKEETRRRVIEVAQELDYIPNARARALVRKGTETIGLVIPEVVNSFFAELAQSIKDTFKRANYNLILCSTDYGSEEEMDYINLFKSGQVEGAIFACVGDMMKKNNQQITQLANSYIPVVYIDRDGVDPEIIPVIKADLFSAAFKATHYLIELGHRRIAFVGQSHERLSGYKKALEEASLSIRERDIFYDYLTVEGGYEVGRYLLAARERPTAILSLNDEMAIGLIQALSEGGLKVPEDISVCGIDNIKISNFYNPPLTTVNVPKRKMGERSAEILLKLLSGERLSSTEHMIVFPTELIVRGSTKALS